MAAWFADLSQSRTFTVTGMGPVIYHPLPLVELEAWGRISGNRPTQWELQTLRSMDLACVEGMNSAESDNGSRHQGIGDYCHDEKVEQCRAIFGATLEQTCSTCPN